MTPVLSVVKGIETSGFEALLMQPVWSDPRELLDVDGGLISNAGLAREPVSPSDGAPLWRCGFRWLLCRRSEMRTWLAHQRHGVGRVRPFWMPSWRSDFTIRQGLGPMDSPCIFVEPNGFEHVYEPGRYGIWIVDVRNQAYLYEIVGYDAETGAVIVRGRLDVIVPREWITLASLVRRVRFDTGRFRWAFTSDSTASVDANVVEVLQEGAFAP